MADEAKVLATYCEELRQTILAAEQCGRNTALTVVGQAFAEQPTRLFSGMEVAKVVYAMLLAVPAHNGSARPTKWIPVDPDDALDNRIRDTELGREEADDGED